MNDSTYAQFAAHVFGQSAMASAGITIALLIVSAVLLTFRDLVNFEKDTKSNAPRTANPDE